MTGSHRFPDERRRGLYEAIGGRRDMRHFLPDAVPDDVLARILHAGSCAPSVGFCQPWNFMVLRDRPLREAIHRHVDEERLRGAERFEGERREQYLSLKLEGILQAPLNLCVTCDRTRFGPHVLGRNTVLEADIYSTVCAVQNLWLAARAEGVGMGWVSLLRPDVVGELLGLPDHVDLVAYLCLGYVSEFPDRPVLESIDWLPRMSLTELVFEDGWQRPSSPAFTEALRSGLRDTASVTGEGRGS